MNRRTRYVLLVLAAVFALASVGDTAHADNWRYEWIGTAPFCGGSANDCTKRGMTYVRRDKRGNGKKCSTGWKVLCKKKMTAPRAPGAGKANYRWFGTAPACGGSVADCTSRGMRFVKFDKRGDGKACFTGRKVLCVTDATVMRSEWIGTAPSCKGRASDCESRDMDYLRSGKSGDGALCLSGRKVLCRERAMAKRDATGDRATTFNLLNWNIFSRPFLVSHDAQTERMLHIPRAISMMNRGRIDAIVFQEAFQTGAIRSRMLRLLARAGFPHATNVTTKFGKLTNGGVFIASRWPIVRQKHYVYSACTGSDCLAAKGVVYARILKRVGGAQRNYHVFGSHMQAWPGAKESGIRIAQGRELKRFVSQQRPAKNDAVIISGDLNADLLNHRKHAKHLLATMSVVMPRRRGNRTITSEPSSNQLVGADGSAADGKNNCEQKYLRSQRCPCCLNEYLDYVVYSSLFRRPRAATYEILTPKARPFPACVSAKMQPHHVEPYSPFCKRTWVLRDLSDHYPVLGRFDFR